MCERRERVCVRGERECVCERRECEGGRGSEWMRGDKSV